MTEPKRRGRPPLDPAGRPSTPVEVSLSPDAYAAAAQTAAQRRESIQDLIRRAVARELLIRNNR